MFGLWCYVCWQWYVCGIKEACTAKTPEQPSMQQPAQAVQEIPADTMPLEQAAAKPDQAAATKPAPAQKIVEGDIHRVQMEGIDARMVIHFPYNSVRKEDNQAINQYLNRLAETLRQSGETVSITGHTDFVGDSKSNYAFGMQRALSIRDILIKKGVKKAQIKCYSKGDSKPIATNDTPQGRYKNRRVVIVINR